MGKRKVYLKTDLGTKKPQIAIDDKKPFILFPKPIPPTCTLVSYGRNATSMRSFDFARWYGVGIDSITYACQNQIERFLTGADAEIEISTIAGYCRSGLRPSLNYLTLRATTLEHEINLKDINRDIIDGYLNHLSLKGITITTQRCCFAATKSVLQMLGRRGLIGLILSGDTATFPRNPFPNSHRKIKGELPLPKRQRQAFAAAVKHAVLPIWREGVSLNSELLVYAFLIVALHTGRNTTPLLEMSRKCLHSHPKENFTFLSLWKRRGHNSSKVALRKESTHERRLESTPTVKTNVERLIRRVIALTESLSMKATDGLQDRVWLYRARATSQKNQIIAITANQLDHFIEKLVNDYGLREINGEPLRLNVSRLRKTFANRIFELLDGDLATTSVALGNSPQVTERNYLSPGENAKKNWKFMGEALVDELLSHTIGATYKLTPMGRCKDPVNGQYAPKDGATCINFLNCLRCNHYAVTGDDLHKLFSFYFRVLAERSRMDKKRWKQSYAYIPRLIDEYIVTEGLRRGAFKKSAVDAAREHARANPHPFWSIDVITDLGILV